MWRLVSVLVALSLLIVIIPAPVTKAGGQPEPNCVVQGNYCVHYYQAQSLPSLGPAYAVVQYPHYLRTVVLTLYSNGTASGSIGTSKQSCF